MGKHTNYNFPSGRRDDRELTDFLEPAEEPTPLSEHIWLIVVILLGTAFLGMITGTLPF